MQKNYNNMHVGVWCGSITTAQPQTRVKLFFGTFRSLYYFASCKDGATVLLTSVATLLSRKTSEFTLKKKQKIIKKPSHTKCLKEVKTKLEKHATGTCCQITDVKKDRAC